MNGPINEGVSSALARVSRRSAILKIVEEKALGTRLRFLFKNRLSYASIKYLNWPSPVFGRFQNRFNKVVIELSGVQFWSEIILVISNRTHAARSFDFEIARMISDQIALHSVQLPL